MRKIYTQHEDSPKGVSKKEYNDWWRCNHKDYRNKYRLQKRHELGISKKYISELGVSYTEKYKRLQNKKYKALRKSAGPLTIQVIQQVYEDNIKKYGTLTCYLCKESVEFRKDHLEHKIPLSRGGNNEYSNLGIACQRCNCKKGSKTIAEYRKESF